MILFTADWHIKLGQKNVPKPWAINRYRMFFEQVHDIEPDVYMHIIGGDIFDRLPNLEELALYFEFVQNVGVKTLIFDGNHEATKKNATFFDNLKEVTTKINPLVEIVTQIKAFGNFSILPYCDLHKPGSIEKVNPNMPLFTHVRGEIPPHVKPEVDLDRFDQFPIVFAGDLHSHSNCQRNIVYPGSPMTTSFHRNRVKTGYLLIDSEFNWEWHEFSLPQLIRKKISQKSEMVPTDYDHTIYEFEGDIQELAKVDNSELLDKKVLKRSSEAALILDKEMSILDELVEYLTFVLELPDDKVKRIAKTFNDNT